jgi:uncharacterized protein (DUF433 family)
MHQCPPCQQQVERSVVESNSTRPEVLNGSWTFSGKVELFVYRLDMVEVVKDPEILGGLPVFAGTRVPLKTLFDSLIAGDSIEEFLEDFPTVSLSQVKAVLAEAEQVIEMQAA